MRDETQAMQDMTRADLASMEADTRGRSLCLRRPASGARAQRPLSGDAAAAGPRDGHLNARVL
jgi:hypothetical protein